MADLNPAIPHPSDAEAFAAAVREAAGALWEEGVEQGDRYFHIPALGRHRGVVHYYLEGHPDVDEAHARRVGEATIDAYTDILHEAAARTVAHADRPLQLAYHTVYLFQVLTLDRGTTSGLLVHDQNDLGILGSLPSHVDRRLFASWADRVPPPQDELVNAIAAALADASPSPVTDAVKQALADAVRAHYKAHPEALELQASGGKIPPTVANHSSS
jgi:coproporphyrinogen III oxidase